VAGCETYEWLFYSRQARSLSTVGRPVGFRVYGARFLFYYIFKIIFLGTTKCGGEKKIWRDTAPESPRGYGADRRSLLRNNNIGNESSKFFFKLR